MRRLLSLLAGVVVGLTAGVAHAGKDPPLPDLPLPDQLSDPIPLIVEDLRPQTLEDPRWWATDTVFGMMAGIPYVAQERVRFESSVTDYLTSVFLRGAAAAGYRFDPNSDDEEVAEDALRLVIMDFFCRDGSCRVALSLEGPLVDGAEVLWRYEDPKPTDEDQRGRRRNVLDRIAETARDELGWALGEGDTPTVVPAAVDLPIVWLPDGSGGWLPATALFEDRGMVCVETRPPSWVENPPRDTIRVLGGTPGSRWGAVDNGGSFLIGVQEVVAGQPVIDLGDRQLPYEAHELAAEGTIPSGAERRQGCGDSFEAPSARPRLLLVDKRRRKLDLQLVIDDPRTSRLDGVFIVAADDKRNRLTNSQVVSLLDDEEFQDAYGRRLESANRRLRTDAIVTTVFGSLMFTGIAMGATASQNSQTPGAVEVGAIGGWCGGIGGVGFGFSLLRFGFAARNHKRLTASDVPEEMELDTELLDALDAYNRQ